MENEYGAMTLVVLRETAKEKGIRSTGMKKQELIEALLRAETEGTKIQPEQKAVVRKPVKSTKKSEITPDNKVKKNKKSEENTSTEDTSAENVDINTKSIQEKTLAVQNVKDKIEEKRNQDEIQEINQPKKTAKKSEKINYIEHETQQLGRIEHMLPEEKKIVKRTNTEEERQNKIGIEQTSQINQNQTSYTNREEIQGYLPKEEIGMQERVAERKNDYIRPQTGQVRRQESNQSIGANLRTNPVSSVRRMDQKFFDSSSNDFSRYVLIKGQQLPSDMEQMDSRETKEGILEVMSDGYGFIRCDNFLPGDNDVYVAPAQIRKMNLKTGDIIAGNTRIRSQNEKFSALLYIKSINGMNPMEVLKRPRFEDLTPIFPNERIHLETPNCSAAMRIVDLISPIGKGQRGMIVSQPKAGKTTLLKQIAKSITKNHPDMHMIILLIDERPEEVTDMKESIEGKNVEVIYSTFDELPENHKRVSEMVIERAKRLVEHKKDVVILLDSITRLARAYNLTVQASGRTLSGGLDPAALHMPKKFFGAARNMREGGSLTILATALVDTGSRMDDVVFEEFKGTGNMELVLDRSLSEKRIFPAIDLPKSSTRRDDLLLDQQESEASFIIRKAFNSMKADDAVEKIIQMFMNTKSNEEVVNQIRKAKFII